MSKNKKIILVSVGVILILILSVLMMRNPTQTKTPALDPPKQTSEVASPSASDLAPKQEMDDEHKKIAKLIDDVGGTLAESSPTAFRMITNGYNWIMAFDAKYAIILIILTLIVIGLVAPKSNKKQEK